jgi:ethanolamine utilization protein EutN
MKVCKVIGKADASIKAPGLDGTTLLVVQAVDDAMQPAGPLVLAVDTAGAGVGEIVAVVTGTPAIRSLGHGDVPYDAAVVAILDHLFVHGRQVYSKSEED